MNQSPEFSSQKSSSVLDKLSGLCDCTVKADYDLKFETYPNESSDTPSCSHTIKGNMKHNMLRMAAAIGAVAVTVALIKAITHTCCRGK